MLKLTICFVLFPKVKRTLRAICQLPSANLVTDAHLAALAMEHGCELISTDSDFSRFPGIRWRNPLI